MKGFEWDSGKQEINLEKHGVDFLDAIEIFNDSNRIEACICRNGEQRYQTIGQVAGVTLFLVYTYRVEKRRIISARRASKVEREVYYEQG